MEYRIVKKKQGWIVQYKKPGTFLNFVIKYKWHHVEDHPFYYRSPDDASKGALKSIKDKIEFSLTFPCLFK